jgi:hypothetical protein
MQSAKAWTSLWILLAVALHAVPILHNERQNQTTWPWLKWAMYKDSRPAGPVVGERRRLWGVTESGRQVRIDEDSAGLSRFVVNRAFIVPWLRGDTTAASRLFAHLNQRRADPLGKIRLSIETYTVTDTGMAVQKQTATYSPDMPAAQ